MFKKFTEKEVLEIFEKEKSIKKTAEITKIGFEGIKRFLIKRKKIILKPPFTDYDNEIINMIKDGYGKKEITEKFNLPRRTLKILEICTFYNLKIERVGTRKYKFEERFFKKIDTKEKAYWLGFIYADGSISERNNFLEIGLKESDFKHLEKFKKALNGMQKIEKRKKTKSCRIIFCSKKMILDLKKLGLMQNKSFKIKFPTKKQVPKELQLDFIRGYFDGDGCFYFNKDKKQSNVGFIGNESFLNKLEEILIDRNIIKIKLRKRKKGNINQYYLRNIDDKKVFLKQIYENSNIYLNRKYEKYKDFKQTYLLPSSGKTKKNR